MSVQNSSCTPITVAALPAGTTLRQLRVEASRLGVKWNDIKLLSKEELWEHLCLISTLAPLWGTDKDKSLLIKKVEAIRSKRDLMRKAFEKAEGNTAAQDGLKFLCWDRLQPEKALDYILQSPKTDQADEVLGLLFDEVQADLIAKSENKAKKFANAGARRGTYVPKALLLVSQMQSKGKEHLLNVRWDESLDTLGLVEQIVGQHEGRPPVIRIRWEVELKGKADITARQELAKKLWEIGYLSSQGILAWDMRNVKVKYLLEKTFGSAIDLAGYNHRLGAPLLPEGFLSGVRVRFWTPIVDGKKQQTDGSGCYDPTHPDMKNLVDRYGAVPMQFTYMTKFGLFAKGIIVPREDINKGVENPTGIILDPLQVKGSQKGKVVDGQIHEGWLGVMTAWNQDRFYPTGFESLQCLDWKDQNVVNKASDLMKKFIKNRVDVVELQGLDGLLDKAARADEQVEMVIRLARAIQAHNPAYSPLSLPLIRADVNNILRKFNYVLLQGAGAQGAQRICVLDASVPRGKCVVSGFRTGQQLVVWRFPNILSQGNKVLESIKPSAHHLWDGKVIRNTIWLNPWDLTLGMQGDDDGDMVGVSDDADLVSLFSLPMIGDMGKKERAQYKIEPVGDKKVMSSLSPEGREYLALDPMGPVGIATMWQAEFYALGSWKHALVMGVFIQYAIDSAKRLVRWPDPNKLLLKSSWYLKEGAWAITDNVWLDLAPGSPFPYDTLVEWMQEQKNHFPEARWQKNAERPNILSWRTQKAPDGKGGMKSLNKLADLDYWDTTAAKSGSFIGGNAVHFCHDIARAEMLMVKDSFNMDVPEVDVREILKEVAASKGIELSLTAEDWDTYEAGLRKSSGLEGFKKKFSEAMKKSTSTEDKQERISEELAKLAVNAQGLTLNEVYTIWFWENTPVWGKAQHTSMVEMDGDGWYLRNRPNYAFRMVAESKMLQVLGLVEDRGCPWLTPEYIKGIKQWFGKGNSWKELAAAIAKNTSHASLVKDENGADVPLQSCSCCKNALTSLLLQSERAKSRGFRPDEMNTIVRELKSTPWFMPGKEGFEEEFSYYSDGGNDGWDGACGE